MRVVRILPLLLLSLVAACATTGAGDGSIAIDTASRGQLLPGANCTVSTGAGSWNVTTPAVVMVGSNNGDLRILCNKNGYRSSEVLYRPSGSSSSSVGVGVGGGSGHVGAGVGFGFPLMLGGGRYPPQITVDMTPQ